MDVIALIAAQGVSRRLPGKHMLQLAGKPVLCHTIDAALSAKLVDRVVFSTDCELLSGMVRDRYGERVAIVLDPPRRVVVEGGSECNRYVDIVNNVQVTLGLSPFTLVRLYGNVPVRPDGLIDRAVERFREFPDGSHLMTAHQCGSEHPYNMVTLDPVTSAMPHFVDAPSDIRLGPSQNYPAVWLGNGGCEVLLWPCEMSKLTLRGLEVEAGSVVEIETLRDYRMAQACLADLPQSQPVQRWGCG